MYIGWWTGTFKLILGEQAAPESRNVRGMQEYWVRLKTFINPQGQMKMNLGIAQGLNDVFKEKEVLVGRSEGAKEGYDDPGRYDFWQRMLKLVTANEASNLKEAKAE